jgi:hypothetical protein
MFPEQEHVYSAPMHRALTLALIIAGALALLLGTVVWDERRASRRCEDYIAALVPPGNLETFRKETAWAWRKLEWECVFTGTRTGRVQRIDIDDTPSGIR